MTYVSVLNPMTGTVDTTTVVLYADDGSINYLNQWSRYWPAYQAWLSAGNTPQPAA